MVSCVVEIEIERSFCYLEVCSYLEESLIRDCWTIEHKLCNWKNICMETGLNMVNS